LVVHFPIALLMLVPLFLLVALAVRRHRIAFALSALMLMAIGTVSVWVAMNTGEAAEDVVEPQGVPHAAIEVHEELAETTQVLFTVLTAVFAVLLAVPLARRKPLEGKVPVIVGLVFLLVFCGSLVQLANTAHAGGMLVHKYGARAWPDAPDGNLGAPGPDSGSQPATHDDD
ncbi:MAG: DUF2231 domain-containing protein, partial [Planctomycetota bacterium]